MLTWRALSASARLPAKLGALLESVLLPPLVAKLTALSLGAGGGAGFFAPGVGRLAGGVGAGFLPPTTGLDSLACGGGGGGARAAGLAAGGGGASSLRYAEGAQPCVLELSFFASHQPTRVSGIPKRKYRKPTVAFFLQHLDDLILRH